MSRLDLPPSFAVMRRLGLTDDHKRFLAAVKETFRSRERSSSTWTNLGFSASRRSIRSSSSSSGAKRNDGTPLMVMMTGSSWQRRPYRRRFALASLSGITFMMSGELLSSNNQHFATFFADEDNRDVSFLHLDVEENAVITA